MDGVIGVLNDVAPHWAGAMWAALWQSTLLAGGVLVVGRTFKKMPPSMRYWLWMLVGLRLIVMPFYSVEVPVFTETSPPTVMAEAGETPGWTGGESFTAIFDRGANTEEYIATAVPPMTNTAILETTPAPHPSLHYTALLMILWAAGLVAALARIGVACLRTRRIITGAEFGNDRLSAIAYRASQLLGLRKCPRVGITEDPVSPFVVGIRNPVVILPRALVTHDDDEKLLVVLAHEFAHIRRRDPLLGWAFALCHTLYFFHPALPFVKRQLLLERERACDDWVLAVSEARPSVYARTLVAVATLCSPTLQATGPALVVGESFQDLKKRLEFLRDDGVRRPQLSPLASVFLSLSALIAAPGIVLSTVALETSSDTAITGTHTPNGTQKALPARPGHTLAFPENRTVGMLRVRDENITHHIDTYYYWTDDVDWRALGPATGDVAIPEGQQVWLMLNAEAYQDMSFLKELRVDDLHRISAMYTEAGEPSLSDGDMAYVAHLTGLRALELTYTNIGDRGLAHLTPLAHLERLWLPRGADDNAMRQVGQLTNLTALYLYENDVSDSGLYHVRKLQHLREISVGGGRMTDRGLQVLTHLPQLEYLYLSSDHFGDIGMGHVSRIPNLRTLKLQGPRLTDRGMKALCESKNLERLALGGNLEITGQSLRNLRNLPSLRMLDLGTQPGTSSPVDDESMADIAACISLERLRPPGEITDAGLAYLETMPRLKHLEIYRRSGGSVTDAGLQSIAKLNSLETLCVQGDDVVTDTGMIAVASLSNLTSLNFSTHSPHVTDAGLAAFTGLIQLVDLNLNFSKESAVTLSGLSQLNDLTELKTLTVYGIRQDGSVLDLSPLHTLENVSLNIVGGVRDADMACFAGLTKLRWLQGIEGISDVGVAHIANLDQLDRIFFRGEGITDVSLEVVGGLPRLNSLSLEGTFTNAGIETLKRLQGLHNLRLISVPPLSEDSLEQLAQSLPNLAALNATMRAAGTAKASSKRASR